MQLFRDFVNDSGLIDVDLKGSAFTWYSNPRSGTIIKEKIDRVLVNSAWRFKFPHATAIALPAVSSNHNPIIFDVSPHEHSGKQFKYEVMWDEHPDCRQVVEEGWGGCDPATNSWETVLKRTKNCSKSINNWQKRTFQNAGKEIPKLKARLAQLKNTMTSEDTIEQIKSLKSKITQLWKQEEFYWGQRSRLKWLRWGDKNTKFFHSTTIQRRSRNRMVRVKDAQGNWVSGQEEIMKAAVNHFKGVYTSERISQVEECLKDIPVLVTHDLNKKLVAEKACNNAIPVNANLVRRRVPVPILCPICGLAEEAVEHCLLLCPWVKPVWQSESKEIIRSFDIRLPSQFLLSYKPIPSYQNIFRQLKIRKERIVLEIQPIVEDILSAAFEFIHCGFTWIQRKGNKAAQMVAQSCLSNRLPAYWNASIPLWLKEQFYRDFPPSRPPSEPPPFPSRDSSSAGPPRSRL
ncbi:Reverse transcriptase zinc-binding domain [Sesbania bispinosa]|nr:Reverse transcriptase zinc-binding domain [Sesbania bispinosa]